MEGQPSSIQPLLLSYTLLPKDSFALLLNITRKIEAQIRTVLRYLATSLGFGSPGTTGADVSDFQSLFFFLQITLSSFIKRGAHLLLCHLTVSRFAASDHISSTGDTGKINVFSGTSNPSRVKLRGAQESY